MDTLSPDTLKAINDLTALGVLALISIGIIGLTVMIVRGNTSANNRNSDENKMLLQLVTDLITALKGLDVTMQAMRDGSREATDVMGAQAVILSSVRDNLKTMGDHSLVMVETVGTLDTNVSDLEKVFKQRTDEIVKLLGQMPDDVAEIVKRHITDMLVNTVSAAPKNITGEIRKAIIAEANMQPITKEVEKGVD